MRTSLLLGGLAALLFALAPQDNPELKQLYDADQKDREAGFQSANWATINTRDAARRTRVRQLLDQGLARTGTDYERAAMVFQHGETVDDALLAHVLAVTALGKGNSDARWLSAATLDRYLHRLKQPQVFGTQFTSSDTRNPAGWTLEPYHRELLPPSVLDANCVRDREDQAAMLGAYRRGEAPPASKRQPCAQ